MGINLEDQTIESKQIEEKEIQYLLFESADSLYGLDILKINEILKPVLVTRLPNAENFVLGVINLRGNIVPIIDIRKILKNEYTELTNFSRIIVCNVNQKLLGLLVEKVMEVVTIKNTDIEGEEVKNFSEQYIQGIGKTKNKFFLLFNLPLLIHQYQPISSEKNILEKIEEVEM